MTIKNENKINEAHVNDMRSAIEHRATWFYLLLDEARKQGIDWDNFARKAIFRCGCFHGDNRFEKSTSLKKFAGQFANELYRKIFEMEVAESTEDKFVVNFHYCPLVAAWLKHTDNEEDIAHLCDIAMEGDRGIVGTFADFEMELHETIASGKECCRIVVKKKVEIVHG